MRITFNLLRRDIESESKVLQKLGEISNRIANLNIEPLNRERVIFTGCGDSYFAGIFGALLLRRMGYPYAYAENAFELYKYYPISKGDIIIAISASGMTKATVDIAKKGKDFGAKIIGVTCSKNSPLLGYSDIVLNIDVKDSVPSPTITTFSMLILIYGLALKLLDRFDPKNFRDLFSKANLSPPSESLIRKYVDTIKNSSHVYFVGSGLGFPLALLGMAKFRENNLGHSQFFELEEFMHYGNIPLSSDSTVILFVDSDSQERCRDCVELLRILRTKTVCFGCEKCDIPVFSSIREPIDVINALNKIHWLTYYLVREVHGDYVDISHGYEIAKRIRV